MANALFDTTVFIDFFRGDPDAWALYGSVLRGELTASYSPLSVYELWVGQPRDPEEMLYYLTFMSFMTEAPLTSGAARLAGGWLRGKPKNTRERLTGDALIAATAAERSETIYTRNVADFQQFYTNVQRY